MQIGITYASVALTAVLWGANFNLSKHVLVDLNALTAAAARFDIAALVMLVVTALKGQAVPLIRHGRAYLTLGLVGIGAFNVLFFCGMQMTSAVNGALIMALNPLVTAVLAFLITGYRPSSRQLWAFPLGLAGVGVVVLGGGAHLRIAGGDLLMLAANLCWALYNVLVGKLLPRDVGALANTTAVMLAGAVALSLVAALAGAPLAAPGADALGSLLLMSLLGTVLAYLFWNEGIARLGAARTAVFLNLVPVSSMVISALEGHPPTPVQLVGGATVIGAVTLASLSTRVDRAADVQRERVTPSAVRLPEPRTDCFNAGEP